MKYQPSNGEGQQQTRGVPYGPVRLETARQQRGAERIGGGWIGFCCFAHTRMLAGSVKPAAAHPATRRSATPAMPWSPTAIAFWP